MPDSENSRVFAVIPAAGRSRRMGRPKLLLPYRNSTVLGELLETLAVPQIAATCVVVRADDAALKQDAESHRAWVVQPDVDPPEMRTSAEFALRQIAEKYHPTDDDAWLLIPADHPLLSRELLVELLTVWQRSRPQILVPTFEGRRGHPTLFRWTTVSLLKEIPADRGLNWLPERLEDQVLEWPCAFPEVTLDLDTPEDYERLLKS